MNPDQWLQANNKKPFFLGEDPEYPYPWHYWGTLNDVDDETDPDDFDFLLPEELFSRLAGKLTYPNVRRYKTAEEALEDFRETFYKLTSEGWIP